MSIHYLRGTLRDGKVFRLGISEVSGDVTGYHVTLNVEESSKAPTSTRRRAFNALPVKLQSSKAIQKIAGDHLEVETYMADMSVKDIKTKARKWTDAQLKQHKLAAIEKASHWEDY